MRSDIDRLMREADLGALLIAGPATHNANKTYFTGPVKVTWGYLLKQLDQPPVLFHHSMEREEAASTGLETKNLGDYHPMKLLEQAGGDRNASDVLLLKKIFNEYEVEGRVGLYGKTDLGSAYGTFDILREKLNGIELVGESANDSVLWRARATKDADEVDRIREMGRITTSVVGEAADYLTSHGVSDGKLVNLAGEVLTVGEVKRQINLWLAMRGAEIPEGMIFAIGAEAGIPHNTGQDDAPVEVGKTIIFDLYPCEANGGYFYDFTRTWCLGQAPEEAETLYQDVLAGYDSVFAELSMGAPCRDFQIMTCERFEASGHPTIMNSPDTTDGYVHSLGHGVGLDVHEEPRFSHLESNTDTLEPGTVFTLEPGLYYPEKGMGARLEDTLWVRPDGELEVLAEYPKELVLEMRGA